VCKAAEFPAVATTAGSLCRRYWSTSSIFARGSTTIFNIYIELGAAGHDCNRNKHIKEQHNTKYKDTPAMYS